MARFTYAFRPAKHIVRRMIVDTCRRLRSFAPLSEYQYVGFGGYEFVDFELVHRELGVPHLISIESDTNSADRYMFNRPFGDIEMHLDRASIVLPELLDDKRLRIVWLDYTSRLNLEVLADLQTAARRLLAGSILIATVNARPASPASARRDEFVADVGEEKVPGDTTDASLAKWGLADAQRRIVVQELPDALRRRDDGAAFEQLFYFCYSDDAPMLTWGGVIVHPGQRASFDQAAFHELEQTRAGADPLHVSVPPLTAKEVVHLNEQLPGDPATLTAAGIPDPDKEAYGRLYRWYPPVPTPI